MPRINVSHTHNAFISSTLPIFHPSFILVTIPSLVSQLLLRTYYASSSTATAYMDVLKTAPQSMKVYKPYSLSQNPPPNRQENKIEKRDQDEETSSNLGGTSPPPQNMTMQPMLGTTVFFPNGPPPNHVLLYQLVPGPSKSPPTSLHPAEIPPGPPLNGAVPPPTPITATKTKPRTVHEYYDQHTFQWREFNPEDTVIGDESDPFIVYFRYANKSIGARRTPWILPKHTKLIKIMQDCLPDFDWRTGEDLLIKARVLYLRRKGIEEAVEKLKRGESIGPVTKAMMEGKDEEDDDDEILDKEKKEVKPEGNNDAKDNSDASAKLVNGIHKEPKEETTTTLKEVVPATQETPAIAVEDTTGAKAETAASEISHKISEEDNSDTHSIVSDVPSTPALTDTPSTEAEMPPPDLADENVHDAKELRQTSNENIIGETERSKEMEVKANDLSALACIPSIDNSGDSKVDPEEKPSSDTVVPKVEATVEVEEVIRPASQQSVKVMEGWEMLQMVIQWTRKEFSADEKALARQLANNEISFRFLWLYFIPGNLISCQDPLSKQQMAARIESTEYMPATMSNVSRFEISTKIIDANGDDFIYSNMIANIPEYDAAKLVSELQVQLLTTSLPLYQTLKERGRKFVSLNGVHYMTLDGVIILNRGRDVLRVKSKTRVMIDCKAFRESNPSYNHSFSGITLVDILSTPSMQSTHYSRYGIPALGSPGHHNNNMPGTLAATVQPKDIKTVPEDELVLCSPTVFGYAFTEKAWVQMTVDGISPIVWDTEAYNKLVLPEDTKKLVKSLVQACRTDTKLIKDIISTKGSGVVFVLHGEPGTGKTLTAEAIGEELKRPILVIAVSDLGTDPTNVEIRLGNFLRTAEKWDSIVLLDEADIFLEQRGRMDIFRNAMVGVFLRLLEYHNSPMFLTTNRVFAFDPAIRSRISIAIKYNPLKKIARKQVWKQLLEMANGKISAADMDELSMSPVNGREIKNTIRSAQALAVADGTELTMKHIKTVLDVQKEFREDFEGQPGTWNGMGIA